MLKTAEVLFTEGKLATVKSDRSSMCDGCHKSSCGNSCAMGAIMGTDKTMTVTAFNEAGAEIGDIVEIETRDSKVLLYALIVFILPIAVCAAMYCVGTALFEKGALSIAFAVAGFLLSYVFIGFYEKLRKGKEPDIVIVRIIKKNVSDIGNEE